MVSHKMTRKGFTLVELIVVITILAILATIAFLSFQGYSASARDGKRSADLASINTKVRVSGINGMSLNSLISDSANKLTTGAKFSGSGAVTSGYDAGKINYVALGLKADDYKDPKSQNDYRMGYVNLSGEYYEVAATMEKDGTPEALVLGNYKARTAVTSAGDAGVVTLIAPVGGVSGAYTATIAAGDIGKLRRGDMVNNGTAGTITKISADGTTLTINTTTATAAAQLVKLADKEADGLVGSGATNAVSNASTAYLPY